MNNTAHYPSGTLQTIHVDSTLLVGNRLGDPTRRTLAIYLPHGYRPDQHLPLLVDLAGFTGSGLSHIAWKGFEENVPERLDRLIGSGAMAPAIVAFPDCFTRLGGNQYINSDAMGPWADVLTTEFVPAIEAHFKCGGAGQRAVFGKSSGGYGALIHALLYSNFWSAAACHSGDMDFELCYTSDFPNALRAIGIAGSIKAFMDKLESKRRPSGRDFHVLMTLAMAATYDPCPESYLGIRLPVDLHTCERDKARWENWLAWDPLTLIDTHWKALTKLKGLFIDCGTMDQYNLLYGARQCHRKLNTYGVAHHYEEFPDTHSGIDYRMDVSLPFLVSVLTGGDR